MIPGAYIQAWSTKAPWPDARQIEQDLIICRALCDLFNSPALKGKIAFRGGTAINKLLFKKPLRYSEDIDLVQTQPEPIGETIDAVRDALVWLGPCKREQAGHSMHLVFKFAPEAEPQATLKLKVEINTREHDNLLGIRSYPFIVANDWYQGATEIASFEPEEIFGTRPRTVPRVDGVPSQSAAVRTPVSRAEPFPTAGVGSRSALRDLFAIARASGAHGRRRAVQRARADARRDQQGIVRPRGRGYSFFALSTTDAL